MKTRFFLLIMFTLCLVACGGNGGAEEETAVSQATALPDPTQPATAVPTATTAPTDTPTPIPPTPTDAPPTATHEPETLTYWAYFGGLPAGDWDEQNVLAYAAAQPNMVADYLSFNFYSAPVPESIHGRMVRDEGPDVMSGFIGGVLWPYVDQEIILDVSDIWAEQGWDDQFSASLKAFASRDGQQYFVPTAVQWNPIWYHTDIFAEHDLTPPETWEDLLAACDTLDAAGIIPIAVSSISWTPPLARWFSILNMRLNEPEFHEQLLAGQEQWDDPRVVDVFMHWAEMFEHNCFDEQKVGYGTAATQFADGEAAMYNLGEWLSESYPEGIPVTADFFAMPIMNPDVPRGEIALVYGAYLHKNGSNPQAGRDFFAYLGNAESQTGNGETLNRIMSNTAVSPDIYSEVYQDGLTFVADADHLVQLFEFSAAPEVAQDGLQLFASFFNNPDPERIEALLADMEATRLSIYGE